MFYKDLARRKEIIRNFIKNNPKTTYREIRKRLGIRVEKVYNKGMKDAFKDAEVKPPRTFKIKTKDEKRRILIEYVKKNQEASGHAIRKGTKINFYTIFKNTKNIFEAAGIEYPREINRRSKEEKKKEIIKLVKENPWITITEIRRGAKTKPYKLFKNIKEIYRLARVREVNGHEKRRIKIKEKVIDFIKKNPLATQREINKACKTHVQELFKKGIFEAYEKAGVEFPYERLNLYGTVLKEIKQRAKSFEDKIAIKLSGFGKVNRLVKTKRGVADIILERKGKKAVIEVKNYESKDISISQIKQLNKYLEDCNCNLGFLICHTKPKKDKFLISKNTILVVEDSELNKIPQLIDGVVC